ncbi:hypothetical protein R5R35_012980 [Gryllus longicercus]|uniref:DH domain-containing protein n=1 Tax=Gryllus longicercus TaxID=2509291 RepID=A0AAN9V1C2_9ORTH
MDKEKFKSSQNSQDWLDSLSDAMNFTLTGESENFFQETHGRINTERFFQEAQERMNNERMNSEKFFQEACERIKASTTRSADFFTVMKENELRSSSKSRFSAMERESHEIIRSFSAGSGWNVQSSEGHISPVSSEECKTPVKSSAQLVTATKPRSQLYSFGGFSRTNHLMSFSLSGTRCFENWSSSSCKLQMSRSTFEYPMSGSMLRSYQETFDVSESESDDDDSPDQSHWPSLPAPRPLSIAPSECTDTSSICTSDGEKSSILAIEASPDHRKEKAYRLANEILTTERSYVQILHLIDQVSSKGSRNSVGTCFS